MSEQGKPTKPEWTRRRLLAALAAGAGASVSGVALAQDRKSAAADIDATPTSNSTERVDPTRTQGAGPSALGARSPFETPMRSPGYGVISGTPLQDLHGTITPADLHFERHHAGIPQIDPGQHELLLHGLVSTPLRFTLADLLRFPAETQTCFLECSGNLRTTAGESTTPQDLCGLTSQSEWTGVRVSTLLQEAGVRPSAKWLLAEGRDAARLGRSIPIEKMMGDAMVAYAQNGEALRPAQGYPMRLLLPGWEGNTNVKWLRRIDVSDRPFMTREETSKYTEPIRGGHARQFSFTMDARSVITTPSYPAHLEPGWHEIRGLAWSGRGKIAQVDVSVDGGRNWRVAKLAGPVRPMSHTRFTLPYNWTGGGAELSSRATDETGYVQPTRRTLIDARGPGSVPYHLNPIVSWIVEKDGRVIYKAEPWT
ncbi:MAG: sulfane dehydrogenase subunit SoxC [Myxococcota bacterium]|jgi:sulfane dehydrogenase subunit SoxC